MWVLFTFILINFKPNFLKSSLYLIHFPLGKREPLGCFNFFLTLNFQEIVHICQCNKHSKPVSHWLTGFEAFLECSFQVNVIVKTGFTWTWLSAENSFSSYYEYPMTLLKKYLPFDV